jgi:hypothetical protein
MSRMIARGGDVGAQNSGLVCLLPGRITVGEWPPWICTRLTYEHSRRLPWGLCVIVPTRPNGVVLEAAAKSRPALPSVKPGRLWFEQVAGPRDEVHGQADSRHHLGAARRLVYVRNPIKPC